jgi:hypothetical protein
MAVFRTTVPIAAPAATVWDVLIDFDRWHEWNPSVADLRGDVRVGADLAMTLTMPGRPTAKVHATLTELTPARRLSWHGNIGSDRLFAGNREFDIDPQPDGTVLLTHVETVTGLLYPLFRLLMGPSIQAHHDNLNRALIQRAESAAAN